MENESLDKIIQNIKILLDKISGNNIAEINEANSSLEELKNQNLPLFLFALATVADQNDSTVSQKARCITFINVVLRPTVTQNIVTLSKLWSLLPEEQRNVIKSALIDNLCFDKFEISRMAAISIARIAKIEINSKIWLDFVDQIIGMINMTFSIPPDQLKIGRYGPIIALLEAINLNIFKRYAIQKSLRQKVFDSCNSLVIHILSTNNLIPYKTISLGILSGLFQYFSDLFTWEIISNFIENIIALIKDTMNQKDQIIIDCHTAGISCLQSIFINFSTELFSNYNFVGIINCISPDFSEQWRTNKSIIDSLDFLLFIAKKFNSYKNCYQNENIPNIKSSFAQLVIHLLPLLSFTCNGVSSENSPEADDSGPIISIYAKKCIQQIAEISSLESFPIILSFISEAFKQEWKFFAAAFFSMEIVLTVKFTDYGDADLAYKILNALDDLFPQFLRIAKNLKPIPYLQRVACYCICQVIEKQPYVIVKEPNNPNADYSLISNVLEFCQHCFKSSSSIELITGGAEILSNLYQMVNTLKNSRSEQFPILVEASEEIIKQLFIIEVDPMIVSFPDALEKIDRSITNIFLSLPRSCDPLRETAINQSIKIFDNLQRDYVNRNLGSYKSPIELLNLMDHMMSIMGEVSYSFYDISDPGACYPIASKPEIVQMFSTSVKIFISTPIINGVDLRNTAFKELGNIAIFSKQIPELLPIFMNEALQFLKEGLLNYNDNAVIAIGDFARSIPEFSRFAPQFLETIMKCIDKYRQNDRSIEITNITSTIGDILINCKETPEDFCQPIFQIYLELIDIEINPLNDSDVEFAKYLYQSLIWLSAGMIIAFQHVEVDGESWVTKNKKDLFNIFHKIKEVHDKHIGGFVNKSFFMYFLTFDEKLHNFLESQILRSINSSYNYAFTRNIIINASSIFKLTPTEEKRKREVIEFLKKA